VLPVLDAEGYATCPDCGSRVNCGTVGLANLEKRHRGKKVCKAVNFLQPKATTVASTLSKRAPVHGVYVPQSATHTSHTILPRQRETVSLQPQPDSVPEASEFDKLAVFGRSPKEFDVPTLDADELWETTLNHILKSTLGLWWKGE